MFPHFPVPHYLRNQWEDKSYKLICQHCIIQRCTTMVESRCKSTYGAEPRRRCTTLAAAAVSLPPSGIPTATSTRFASMAISTGGKGAPQEFEIVFPPSATVVAKRTRKHDDSAPTLNLDRLWQRNEPPTLIARSIVAHLRTLRMTQNNTSEFARHIAIRARSLCDDCGYPSANQLVVALSASTPKTNPF